MRNAAARYWEVTRPSENRGNWSAQVVDFKHVPGQPAGLRSRVLYLSVWQWRHKCQKVAMLCFVRVGGGFQMKKTIATVTLSLALTSSAAMAQERTGDAALGALSGAVVLGPIGAVAGAIVGYTAGPSIASAWGLRRSSYPRRTAEPGPSASYRSSARPREAYAAMPAAAPPSPPTSGSTLPPIQPLE